MIQPFILTLLVVGAIACNTETVQAHKRNNVTPNFTVQFTAALPEQTAPVSTVYGAIVTEYINVRV